MLTSGELARFHQQRALHRSGLLNSGHGAVRLLYNLLVRQAAVLSNLDAFRFLAALFLVISPVIWLMRKPRPGVVPPS